MNSIKKIRLRAGLSQAELAARSNIDQGNISKHEAGLKLMREDTVRKLCKALDCTPTQLLKEPK